MNQTDIINILKSYFNLTHIMCLKCGKKISDNIMLLDKRASSDRYRDYYYNCCFRNHFCIGLESKYCFQQLEIVEPRAVYYTYYSSENKSYVFNTETQNQSYIDGYISYDKFKKMQNFK